MEDATLFAVLRVAAKFYGGALGCDCKNLSKHIEEDFSWRTSTSFCYQSKPAKDPAVRNRRGFL